jgi:hypothetical protein
LRRTRLRVEAVLASLSGFLLVLTLVVPDWIEVVFRVDPDAGSGELEWLIAGALAFGTVGFGLAARREWRLSRA